MSPKLPTPVILMMSDRAHRMHHYLWHSVRDGWLSFDEATRTKIRALGWEPPRPARRTGANGRSEAILDNNSGEDFFYMHRQMIAAVNTLLTSVGGAAYPKVEGWNPLPVPADADWPVPVAYSVGDAGTDAYIANVKTDAFYGASIVPWQAAYTDPARLKSMSLGELGARVETTVHNTMHMRFSAKPTAVRPDSDPEALDAVDPKWDDPSYNWLGDTYSSHVNPTFWKLHGWVDRCIDNWMAANGLTGAVPWKGTWAGPMPMDPHPASVFALMPMNRLKQGPMHADHMQGMVAVARLVIDSGVACHFYDDVFVPPLPPPA